jgi:acyl-CoA thioesterase-1
MLILLLILLLIIIYLNRSYAYFYNYLGSHKLTAPQATYSLEIKSSGEVTAQTVKTYVALGDSLTAGVGVENINQTLPYLISEKMLDKTPQVNLINLAALGATSNDLVNNQLPKVKDLNPDLVTVFIGINDVHNFVSPKTFEKNLDQAIKTLKQTPAKILVISIPYLGSKNTVYFPYQFLLDDQTKKYNQILRKISLENNVQYVDIYSGTEKLFKESQEYYSSDLFHPNQKGYQLFSNYINAN